MRAAERLKRVAGASVPVACTQAAASWRLGKPSPTRRRPSCEPAPSAPSRFSATQAPYLHSHCLPRLPLSIPQDELDLVLINTLGMAAATGATAWLVAPSRSYGSIQKFPWQQVGVRGAAAAGAGAAGALGGSRHSVCSWVLPPG